MFEDFTDEDENQFLRRVAAFRGKFDLTSLSLPELIQRQKIVSKKLVDEDNMHPNRRKLLNIASLAFAKEIHQRFMEIKGKRQNRWED